MNKSKGMAKLPNNILLRGCSLSITARSPHRKEAMSWQQSFSTIVADVLRLIVRGALLIDCILIAAFSTWFVFKSVLEIRNWLNGWLFD